MASPVQEPVIPVNALSYYLKRICSFLESDNKKTIAFPKIASELQEILSRVVNESPDFLDSDEFSEAVRLEAGKVRAALKLLEAKDVTILGEIRDGKHGPNVLSYIKKEKNPEPVFKVPGPLSQPSVNFSQETSVTRMFKIHCLNVCSKFVKDDTQLLMQFPEMTDDQAQFLFKIIKPGTEGKSDTADDNLAFQCMYAPLWKSMRELSVKYDYRIDYGTRPVTKEGMKRVLFEKIPKSKKTEPTVDPEIIDVDALYDDDDGLPVVSNKPISNVYAKVRQNIKLSNKQQKQLTVNEKVVQRVARKMKKGTLSAEFVHDACQRVAEFVMDDEKHYLVFKDVTFKNTQFIESLQTLACDTLSYMLFTYQVQRYLDDIAYCHNVKKVRYFSVRDKENKTFVLQKLKTSKAATDDSETLSITSESTVNSAISKTSNLNRKEVEYVQELIAKESKGKAKNLKDKLESRIKNGLISSEFIQTSLQRILDFFEDGQQESVLFKDPTLDQQVFLQKIRAIVLNQSLRHLFDATCQTLLESIAYHLVGDIQYQMIQCQGGRDFQLMRVHDYRIQKNVKKDNKLAVKSGVKLPQVQNQVLPNQVQNQVTTNQVKKQVIPNQTRKPPPGIEELIELKSVVYNVLKHSGDQAVADFLRDISNFLTAGNIDRSITFDDLTDFETKFVKNVHVASKNEDVYPMFTRDCQKLLRNIRLNAQSYKLTVKVLVGETKKNYCTIVLEKQTKPVSPHKVVVQHRARSLSAGRRAAQLVANLKIDRIPRGSSGQRPKSVKDKLKAALAQPVQSDKALKMMQSMGWKGGALGARGDGITEPITLPLDLVSRAGLGHVPPLKKTKKPKPKKQPRQEAPAKNATDVTSQLMGQSEKPKEWMRGLVPPGILPPGFEPAPKSETVVLRDDYRYTVLRCILELINSDLDAIYFVSPAKSPEKVTGFLKHAVNIFNMRSKFNLDTPSHVELVQRIETVLDEHREIELNAELRDNDVVVKKTKLIQISRKRNKNKPDGIKLTDEEFTNDDDATIKEAETCDVIDLTDLESTSNGDTTIKKHIEKTTDDRMDLTDQESTNEDNTTTIEDKERTDNIIDLTLESESRACRPWYFPVKKNNKKIIKPKITTQVPALQALALCKVFEAIDQVKYGDISNETSSTMVERGKSINVTEGDTKSVQDASIKNSQVVEKDNDIDMTRDAPENSNMPQLSTNVDASSTQINEPNTTASAIPDDHVKDSIDTEEASNIVDPQIINETAMVIQKALEKILSIPKTKENATYSNNKETEPPNTSVETNVQKPAQVKTLVKNIKIPNMTRKQLALLKEHGVVPHDESQKTTYRLRVEEYKIDKGKHVDVKVNKYTSEMALNEAKRRKTKKNLGTVTTRSEENVKEVTTASEEIVEEVRKTPGIILLEKLMVTNNDDSTQNKNKVSIKIKSSVANHLINAVSSPDSKVNEQKNDKSNNTSLQITIKNDSNKPVSKPVPVVNKVAPMIKHVETIDLTEDKKPNDNQELTIDKTEVKCTDNAKANVNVKETTILAKTDNTKANVSVKETTTLAKNSNNERNETDSVTYVIPVECAKKIESLMDKQSNIEYNNTDISQGKRKIIKAVRKSSVTKPNGGLDNHNAQNVKDDSIPTAVDVKETLTHDNAMKQEPDRNETVSGENITPVEIAKKVEVETKNKQDKLQDRRKIIKVSRKNTTTKPNSETVIENDESVSTVVINDKNETVLLTPNTKADVNKEPTVNKKKCDSVSEYDSNSDQFYDSIDVLTEKETQPTYTKRQSIESDTDSSFHTSKKSKLPFYKKVTIRPKNYLQTVIDGKKASEIQSAILESIDYTKVTLPILKCQGIQNGGLVYDCQDEKSLLFLENLIKIMSELKLTYEVDASEKSTHKMAFRINSYLDEPEFEILNRLEMYSGLNASDWLVFKKENHEDFRVIYVEMDERSYDYVCFNNFVLCAGNDCARFSIIWD